MPKKSYEKPNYASSENEDETTYCAVIHFTPTANYLYRFNANEGPENDNDYLTGYGIEFPNGDYIEFSGSTVGLEFNEKDTLESRISKYRLYDLDVPLIEFDMN